MHWLSDMFSIESCLYIYSIYFNILLVTIMSMVYTSNYRTLCTLFYSSVQRQLNEVSVLFCLAKENKCLYFIVHILPMIIHYFVCTFCCCIVIVVLVVVVGTAALKKNDESKNLHDYWQTIYNKVVFYDSYM